MNDTRATVARGPAWLAAALMLPAMLAGCGNSSPEDGSSRDASSQDGSSQEASTQNTYTVRGRVAQLPDRDGVPPKDLSITHEQIEDFVGASGEVPVRDGVRGMRSMTMPFPRLDEGVSLEGVEVGDPVEFELNVIWNGGVPNFWISSLKELPADTELDLPGEPRSGSEDGDRDSSDGAPDASGGSGGDGGGII